MTTRSLFTPTGLEKEKRMKKKNLWHLSKTETRIWLTLTILKLKKKFSLIVQYELLLIG